LKVWGGRIGFESEESSGSLFWVDLPLSVQAAPDNVEQPSKPQKQAALPVPKLSKEKTVLYVEDNDANRALMELIVGRLPNVRLVVAKSGEEGLVFAEDNRPDLVLMDINLPGMSGIDTLKALRIMPNTKDVAVVAVSAAAMFRDVRKGKEAGFDEYVVKPFDIPEVQKVINRYLAETLERDEPLELDENLNALLI